MTAIVTKSNRTIVLYTSPPEISKGWDEHESANKHSLNQSYIGSHPLPRSNFVQDRTLSLQMALSAA